MHNFLAETPEFFLENGTFTSFISKPESEIEPFIKGEKYSMRVRIKKSYNNPINNTRAPRSFSFPWIGFGKETIVMYSRPSAFGPPVAGGDLGPAGLTSGIAIGGDFEGAHFGGSEMGHNGPYTPPYWDGSAHVVILFQPEESRTYTISEIQASSSTTYQRYPYWNGVTLPSDAPEQTGPMGLNGGSYKLVVSTPEQCSMQVSASLNIFGKVSAKDLFKFQNVDLTEGNHWAIQSKFETPILNFIDASSSAGLTPIVDSANLLSGGAESRPYGMWHQYGRLPKGEEGIYMEIDDPLYRGNAETGDTPDAMTSVQVLGDLSLADHLGFSKEQKKMGRVAPNKTIREAVVAVPFVEENNERKFFGIDRRKIDTAINDLNSGPQASLSEDPEAAGDSIRQMVELMDRFIMPPSFDFLTYPDDVDPIAMYIFEFTHTLNQEDLTDIWQNLPPRIARSFEPTDGLETDEIMQTKEITHSIGNAELLTDVEDKLQWMVFKVKQRAQKNYFNKTIANTKPVIPTSLAGAGLGAALTKRGVQDTNFVAGGTVKDAVTKDEDFKISYNWPYDFFSLVELAKIDEDVVFGTPVAVTVDQDFDASTITPGDGGFTMPTKKVSKTVVEQIADQATGGFTQEGVQNSFKTETTKTVASQVDPSNPKQFVRTGVVTKVDSNSSTIEALMGTTPEAQAQAEAVEALASGAIPPTKKVSTSVNNNSTTITVQEETVTEMKSSDSIQEAKNIGQIKKSDLL